MKRTRTLLVTLFILSCLMLLLHFSLNPGGERTERVFVYGTLTNPIIRSLVCRCFVDEVPAQLSDYSKVGRLNIAPAAGSSVTGEIIIVSAWELSQLDAYERVPEHYQRLEVTVGGTSAWVYQQTED